MPEATKLFGVFGFLCVQDDGRNQTMDWCLFFKLNHQMRGVVVFKYLVFCWKAGTSHMLLERETAIQGSGESWKSLYGSCLSVPTTQTEMYLQHICSGPIVFFNCDFGLVYETIYFSWSWEDTETKSSSWAKHRKVWCAEHISSSGLWHRLVSKLFSPHSLAKTQQLCYVQTIICKDLCLCFPKMMYLYKKAEGNLPSHWEMLVLIPDPMWASEHQHSKVVQEEDRSHLW